MRSPADHGPATRGFFNRSGDQARGGGRFASSRSSAPTFSSIANFVLTPAPFRVSSEQAAGALVIEVEGELDMHTAAQLERELEAPLSIADTALVIDLSRCEFIDSTGIALLVRTSQELNGGGRFALCGVGDQVARVLSITGLDTTIPNHPDRETALAKIRS